jgi:hypothetical protein
MERYISLYPVQGKEKKGPDDQSAAARALGAKRPEMWSVVEEAIRQGEKALVRLRERVPESLGKSAAETANSMSSKAETIRKDKSSSQALTQAREAKTGARSETSRSRPANNQRDDFERENDDDEGEGSDSDFLEEV